MENVNKRDFATKNKYVAKIREARLQIENWRKSTIYNAQEVKNRINDRETFIQECRSVISRLDLANGTNWISEV